MSLVLVLAMALSMFGASAFAAGTTDYTDDADLTYGSKAVAVMSDLGIINGHTDGSFEPFGDYTREQAAKVITYMLATADVAEKLDAPAKDVFADVPADHWAAAYIAYAVDKEIIAGHGDGTFGPNDPLTRDQWLKMLLVALGKDPVKEGLIGDKWDTNAAVLAMKTFITPEEYELTWDRETAVYYAFKALTSFEIKGETLAEKIYDMHAEIIYDDFAAPVSIKLTNGYPENSKYYKHYATIDVEPVEDWSNTVTTLKDYEDYFETKFTVYVDGKKADATIDCVSFKDGAPATVGCNSADVKLYREPNGDYRVIVKNAYFDPATKTEYTIGYYKDTVKGVKFETGKLAAVPQTVTEKDTRNPASYVELDGEKELYACTKSPKDVHVGVKYDVYYDSFGNVIYIDDFHPYAPDAELVYVYDSIVTAEPVYAGVGFDKIVGLDYTAQAKVMHMDGTLETVDLAVASTGPDAYIVNKYGYAGSGNMLDDGSVTLPEYFEGDVQINNLGVTPTVSKPVYNVADKTGKETGYGNFYNMYTFDDGTVTLEATAGDKDSLGTTKGSRVVTGLSTSASVGPFANGSTKIHVITIDPAGDKIVEDGEVTLEAKGIANFDTASYVDAYVALNAAGTVATEIYAIALKNNVTYTYAYYLGTTVETIEDGLNYEFGLSDGSKITYTASVGNPANYIGGLEKGTVYKVELTRGLMTNVTELTAHKQGYGVEDDGYFVLLRDPNTQRDVDGSFGGYAWGADGAKLPATYENADKADYLVLYYDVTGAVKDATDKVVFATYIPDPDGTGTIDTIYTGSSFVTADGKDIFTAAGTTNWADKYYAVDKEITADDVVKYYAAKAFTFTYTDVYDIDGVLTRTLTQAVTQADDFYLYNGSDTLTYIDKDAETLATDTVLEVVADYQYGADGSNYTYCTSENGVLFVEVDSNNNVIGTDIMFNQEEPEATNIKNVKFLAKLNCVDDEQLTKIVVFTRVDNEH